MSGAVILAFAALGAIALAFRAAPWWQWVAGFGTLLAAATALGTGVVLLLAAGWVAWGLVLAAGVTPLRRRIVSAPLLARLRRVLPAVSATEREALEAGTVWWDAELFSGRPRWSRLLELPPPQLSAAERAFLDGPVEELCRRLDDWRINHELLDLPPEIWSFIRERGFLGIIVPERYGGLGFSPLAHSAIVMKIATRCGTAAVTVMVPNSLGPAELLLRYGTEVQKEYYLPRLARGEEIPCFALTNPYAGSDAASIPDTGIVCWGEHEGRRVLGMRVTFEKRYITLAPVATLVGLAFRLLDPDGLLGGEADVGITLALVPADHPGVEIGARHRPAGQAFQNGPVRGRDVFVPMSMVIGGQARCGQGWRMLMACLAAGRSISLPALATGALKHAARTTGAYARVRTQFRVPIGRMEGVEEPLARIAADAYAVDAARTVTAQALAAGEEPAVISALLKYQATERMRRGINDAMDVHGGRGVIDGPSNYLLRGYQSVPIAITVEGANILTRSLIVFGQGAIRCHPWLRALIDAAQSNDVDAFDRALTGHLRHVVMLLARALVHNLTGARLARPPVGGPTARRYAALERACVCFALVAEAVLMVYGGELKRRQKIAGRLADVLGELYLASCALKRFEDDGRPQADLVLVEAVCERALAVIEARLDAVLANLPVGPLARALRLVVLPRGRRARGTDRLGQRVAALLLEPSPARDRLTAGIFLSEDPQDPCGCLEHGLRLALETEALERRLEDARRHGRFACGGAGVDEVDAARAAGIVEEAGAELLRRARAAARKVIDVDEFPAEALRPPAAAGAHTGT